MGMSKKDLISGYQLAKAELERQEQLVQLYRQAYKVYKKMEYLVEKYPDLMWSECPERKNKEVPLAFCIEKCTGKCSEWQAIRKHHPKLIEVVGKINNEFDRLVRRITDLKRG